MHRNCLTNEGPGNSGNSMVHDSNLIKPGEYHDECILLSFRSIPWAICLEMHENHKIMTNGWIDERVNVAGD